MFLQALTSILKVQPSKLRSLRLLFLIKAWHTSWVGPSSNTSLWEPKSSSCRLLLSPNPSRTGRTWSTDRQLFQFRLFLCQSTGYYIYVTMMLFPFLSAEETPLENRKNAFGWYVLCGYTLLVLNQNSIQLNYRRGSNMYFKNNA